MPTEESRKYAEVVPVSYVLLAKIDHFKGLDKRLTADKCARKHVCGHFWGMKGNNA